MSKTRWECDRHGGSWVDECPLCKAGRPMTWERAQAIRALEASDQAEDGVPKPHAALVASALLVYAAKYDELVAQVGK